MPGRTPEQELRARGIPSRVRGGARLLHLGSRGESFPQTVSRIAEARASGDTTRVSLGAKYRSPLYETSLTRERRYEPAFGARDFSSASEEELEAVRQAYGDTEARSGLSPREILLVLNSASSNFNATSGTDKAFKSVRDQNYSAGFLDDLNQNVRGVTELEADIDPVA